MDDQPLTAIVSTAVVAPDGLERFDRAEPDAHFAIPAHPTVRQQLEYYSRYADTRREPLYLRMWHSAQPLITEWQCAALPDPKVDLDQITNAEATTVIMWVGNAVLVHMESLDALPKA